MTCCNSYWKDRGVSQKSESSACLFRLVPKFSLTFSKPATDHGKTTLRSRNQWWPLLLPQWPFAIVMHGECYRASWWWRRHFRCGCLIVVCAAVWTQRRGLGIGGVVCHSTVATFQSSDLQCFIVIHVFRFLMLLFQAQFVLCMLTIFTAVAACF